jgi:hypothetical protein
MPQEAQHGGAYHVAMDQWLGRDLEETDPCLTTALHGVVGLHDPPSQPELVEDSSAFLIGRIQDLGVTSHLDGGWWEKPEEVPSHWHDEGHLRILCDAAPV